MKGEIEGHGLSWTQEALRGSGLDVSSSELPCRRSGNSHDFSIDGDEFWPLKVGTIDIEWVLFSSGIEEEKLSRGLLILVGIGSGVGAQDIFGDVGADSNLLGDVSVDEGVGVRGRVVV